MQHPSARNWGRKRPRFSRLVGVCAFLAYARLMRLCILDLQTLALHTSPITSRHAEAQPMLPIYHAERQQHSKF